MSVVVGVHGVEVTMSIRGSRVLVAAVGSVAVFLLAACSGSDSSEEASGPAISSDVAVTVAESTPVTDAVDRDRALGLPVDPPSTTISTDPDEQAAADVVYLYVAMLDKCIKDFAACDSAPFEKIATKNAIETDPALSLSAEERDQYESILLDFDAKHEIRWIKKIDGAVPIIQVLHCPYLNRYLANKGQDQGTEYEFGAVRLMMSRVIQRDGRWQLDSFGRGIEITPTEYSENACRVFDGTPQEEFLALTEEGPKE